MKKWAYNHIWSKLGLILGLAPQGLNRLNVLNVLFVMGESGAAS